jgi:hypothetical protein
MVVLLLAAEVAAEPLTPRGLDGQVLRVQLEPGATRLVYTLHLDELANARVGRARLRVSGLRDASGAHAAALRAVGADGQPLLEFPVEPGGSVPVTLEAELPMAGTYEATLTVLQEGTAPSSARLVVSRPRSTLNVDLDVAPVRAYSPFIGSLGEATLQFTLHEKEGSPILLPPPVLARLVHKDGDASGDMGLQALANARFLDSKGQPLEAPFLLDRRMTLPLRLELSDLPGPGRYEGTIRIGGGDAPAIDMPFVLYLRERPLVAFLLIALGVVLSFLVRKYISHERPRMVLQHRVLGMAQALAELKASPALPPRDLELLTSVAREVDGVLSSLSTQTLGLGRIGARLEVLESKVACARNWLRLRRAVDEMRPASLRAEPQAKLDQVERCLHAPGATAEDLGAAEATLASLPSELDARMKQHLSERLALFREELDKLASDPTSELARQLELHVRPSLDRAGALLGGDLRAAFGELDAARLAQTTLLVDRLTASLEGPVPAYLGHEEWVALRVKVDPLLKPLRQTPPPPVDAAVSAYESGLTLYARTLGRALADKARASLRLTGAEDPAETREHWQRALDSAGNVLQYLSERKLPEAVLALESAHAAFEVATTSRSAEPGLVSFSSSDEPEEAPGKPVEEIPGWLFDGVRLFVPSLEGKPPAENLARLGKRLAALDLFILVLVLGVAALTGLRLLWMEQPAWGSLNDWLIALMWGFGLHQAAHPGLSGLLGRTVKQEAPGEPAAPVE